MNRGDREGRELCQGEAFSAAKAEWTQEAESQSASCTGPSAAELAPWTAKAGPFMTLGYVWTCHGASPSILEKQEDWLACLWRPLTPNVLRFSDVIQSQLSSEEDWDA